MVKAKADKVVKTKEVDVPTKVVQKTVVYNRSWLKLLVADPLSELARLDVPSIVALMQALQAAYYNKNNGLVSDDIYDIVKEYLRTRDPDNPIINFVGANVADDDKRKVTLPVWMGSMDKLKADERAIESFKAKYPGKYVITEKLDGNSALLVCDALGGRKMYTRGNGAVGQDISHLIPFIQGTGAVVPGSIVRGELILSRASWDKISDKGANARNTVAGVVNAKTPDLEVAKHIIFVAYAVIEPPYTVSSQMKFLVKKGYKCVEHVVIDADKLNVDWLSKYLVKQRDDSEFEIDGIIVAHDEYHPVVAGKNPAYAFAFKHLMTKATAEVIVTQVEWKVSKDGLLKPTVVFLPVSLSGVTIRRATGFNGDFIKSGVIGPGAHLVITRSGDVIPHILEVLTPAASGKPQMPDMPFVWTEGGKEIKTTEVTAKQDLRQLTYFFEKMKIRGVSTGTVTKLYEAGHKSVRAILDLGPDNGIMRDALVTEIKKTVKAAKCVDFMVASNAFGQGFGERKLTAIAGAMPRVTYATDWVPKLEDLCALEGVSNITAVKFIDGLKKYREFMEVMGLSCKVATPSVSTSASTTTTKKGKAPGKWAGEVVVFTGFRNKAWEDTIKEGGGVIGTSVSGKTTLVVAKDPTQTSGKLKTAADKGIRIVGMDDFSP